ncbi:restless-like transposase [Purpureocillium lavendulum]|uniref:Restless-like transposase n=1 Tax=Purpureocillium lavendulum TaxID=1247861 RepID=A0AB34G985_9HYPO|nr:restless-like transposase [Purpureocillium lavendulum]
MSPNGQAYLVRPDAPEGSARFPQARFAPASGHRTLYVSGTACVRPTDGTWPGVTDNGDGTLTLDIRTQTAAVLDNIDTIISGATDGKGGVQNLIDAVVYLVDMKRDYAGMNEEWNRVFATRASAPARATVGVKELPDPRMIVEVKAVAVVDIYVRALEQRVRDLEAGAGRESSQQMITVQVDEDPTAVAHNHHELYQDLAVDDSTVAQPIDTNIPSMTLLEAGEASKQHFDQRFMRLEPPLLSPPSLASPPAGAEEPPTFARELHTLSLGATAERHLGSTSGLSFAKITQRILKRLTPDKADFVFAPNQEDVAGASFFNFNSPSDVFNDSLYEDLSESISVHPLLFSDLFLADNMDASSNVGALAWPSDEQHVERLVHFYFAHSHTLYPILDKAEVMETVRKIKGKPHELACQSALQNFRLWMVLAIGSTAYSSLSLTEESESMGYYEKALQYVDQALEQDEMSALEALMLQVSYSFFNQLGPNTWFLVGTAARLALGLGLHTPSAYDGSPFNVQQRRKRIFFSIYMMDRVVSIALGRPFAIHDDDIEVAPFTDFDHEDSASGDMHLSKCLLQPPVLSVPLHILRLRQLASKISRLVYKRGGADRSMQGRHRVLASLHEELLQWRRSMPFPLPDTTELIPHLHTLWYDFNYYTHLAMIYRPSPLCPAPSADTLQILGTAASMSLRQAFAMHKQRRFAYNWLNFLAIFTSTLSLVYAITARPGDMPAVLKETKAVEDLGLAIQLFETFAIKFAAAQNICRMIQEIARRYNDISAQRHNGSVFQLSYTPSYTLLFAGLGILAGHALPMDGSGGSDEEEFKQLVATIQEKVYWEWPKYASAPEQSPIFNGDPYSLGGNGDFVPHEGEPVRSPNDLPIPASGMQLPPGLGGGYVTTGPFANMSINLGPLDSVAYNPRQIKRDVGPAMTTRYANYTTVLDLLCKPTIEEFRYLSEGVPYTGDIGPHIAGHVTIGGDPGGDLFISPGDPVFYTHHGMMDRMWTLWQAIDPEARRDGLGGDEVYGHITWANTPPSRKTALNDTIDLGYAGDSIQIADVMDTLSGPLCYFYL